jgi:hypothetical protein
MANPLWLRLVLRVERAIGEPVEKAVSSDTYFDTVSTARRTGLRIFAITEGLSRRAWHLFNLPAGSDIQRVREQLAQMDRRLVQIRKELDDLDFERQSASSVDQAVRPVESARRDELAEPPSS